MREIERSSDEDMFESGNSAGWRAYPIPDYAFASDGFHHVIKPQDWKVFSVRGKEGNKSSWTKNRL